MATLEVNFPISRNGEGLVEIGYGDIKKSTDDQDMVRNKTIEILITANEADSPWYNFGSYGWGEDFIQTAKIEAVRVSVSNGELMYEANLDAINGTCPEAINGRFFLFSTSVNGLNIEWKQPPGDGKVWYNYSEQGLNEIASEEEHAKAIEDQKAEYAERAAAQLEAGEDVDEEPEYLGVTEAVSKNAFVSNFDELPNDYTSIFKVEFAEEDDVNQTLRIEFDISFTVKYMWIAGEGNPAEPNRPAAIQDLLHEHFLTGSITFVAGMFSRMALRPENVKIAQEYMKFSTANKYQYQNDPDKFEEDMDVEGLTDAEKEKRREKMFETPLKQKSLMNFLGEQDPKKLANLTKQLVLKIAGDKPGALALANAAANAMKSAIEMARTPPDPNMAANMIGGAQAAAAAKLEELKQQLENLLDASEAQKKLIDMITKMQKKILSAFSIPPIPSVSEIKQQAMDAVQAEVAKAEAEAAKIAAEAARAQSAASDAVDGASAVGSLALAQI